MTTPRDTMVPAGNSDREGLVRIVAKAIARHLNNNWGGAKPRKIDIEVAGVAVDAITAFALLPEEQRVDDHVPDAGNMVPAGTKPWSGGDCAPADWDGGSVMLRNGATSVNAQRWTVGYPNDVCNHPTGTDIIAYTPRPTNAPTAVNAGESAEVQRLMHVIDRDRYVVAHCIGRVTDAIRGRTWLLEGRGPYEWDDDRYREEFADAIKAIEEAVEPLRIVGWDKSDCTRIEERVNAARLAARELLAKPLGPRGMIEADIFGDPRDAEIDRLRAQLAALRPPQKSHTLEGVEAMREACARELEARATRAREAAIGGGMDPLDASLLDYEYSNAAAAIRALPTPDAPVDALMGEVDNRFGLTEGEWFYPEGEHSSDECRFSPDEVIDYALEGDATTQVVAVERAMSLPTVYAAVRVWSDAEKDDRQSDDDYDYTLHASADDARAALAQVQSINPTTLSGEGGEG